MNQNGAGKSQKLQCVNSFTVQELVFKLLKCCTEIKETLLNGHEHNFINSAAQKHVYTNGNLLTVVKYFLKLLSQCTEDKYKVISLRYHQVLLFST